MKLPGDFGWSHAVLATVIAAPHVWHQAPEIYAWTILALATAFIMAIAVRSTAAAIAGKSAKRRNQAATLV